MTNNEEMVKITSFDIPDELTNYMIKLCMLSADAKECKAPNDNKVFKMCFDVFPQALTKTDVSKFKSSIKNDPITTKIFQKLWIRFFRIIESIEENITPEDYIKQFIKSIVTGYEHNESLVKDSYLNSDELFNIFNTNKEIFVASLISVSDSLLDYTLIINKAINNPSKKEG